MEIVHLAGVRDDGHRMRFGQRGDLTGLSQAADAVGVELDVVHRARFQQLTKTIKGKFVLATGDGD